MMKMVQVAGVFAVYAASPRKSLEPDVASTSATLEGLGQELPTLSVSR